MPESTTTIQNQLNAVVTTAIAKLYQAKDTTSLSDEVFSRELFDGFITDTQTLLDSLEEIE